MRSTDVLKEALPYIRRFSGARFVVKLSGEAVDDPLQLVPLAEEIALLHYVGMKVLVVHGGGAQATELSKALGIEPRIVQGRRVTDEKTLDVAKMVFAGKINVEILSALRRAGARAVGLSGVDGDILHARRRPPTRIVDHILGTEEEVDFGFVGDVEDVDASLLEYLLDGGYIPVLSSLGADKEGTIFNINADTVATEIAIAIRAAKIIYLTNVRGVLVKRGGMPELVTELTPSEARELIVQGEVTGGMIPKLENAIRAVERGVGRSHIISGDEEDSLLKEIFTKGGTGTMVALR
ncbi:MAG: acetylglutamate kinase [Planctomycetes bacterium]|nr:acetylglutamate kinase [Planctomycetota bacterium]